jgi:hypothetical protein
MVGLTPLGGGASGSAAALADGPITAHVIAAALASAAIRTVCLER